MKLETRSNDVEKHGEMKSSIVGIAADGGATMIGRFLRNKVYTYKIRAIVREYCTNAIDEHIVCGKADLPIKIIMPDGFESNLKIQDFGRGLSDYDVRNIFGMFAASTKRNSNALNGAMGLGSKSGWAYNDFWQLTSVHNQVRTEYSMFLNENDESEISELVSVPDTESPSGCTITIPIAKEDIPELRLVVAELAHDFTVPPTIIGLSNPLVTKEVKYSLDIDGVEVLLLKKNIYSRDINVLMANVSYPVDASIFGLARNYYDSNRKKNDLKFALPQSVADKLSYISSRFNVQINMPIGDVQVGMAREGLEYTESTKRKLFALLSKIPSALEEIIENQLKDEPFLAMRFKESWFGSAGHNRSAQSYFASTLTNTDSTQYKLFVLEEKYSYRSNQYTLQFHKSSIAYSRYSLNYLVIGDLPEKESKQVVKFFNSVLNEKLGGSKSDMKGTVDLVFLPANVTPDEYVKALGLKEGFWALASTLPTPTEDIDIESTDDVKPAAAVKVKPKALKTSVAKEKREAKFFIPTRSNPYATAKNTKWNVGQFDPNVKNYIFEINAFNIVSLKDPHNHYDSLLTPADMVSKIEHLKAFKIIGDNDNVFGVRTQDLEEALKEGCVRLVDLTKNQEWRGLAYSSVENSECATLFEKAGLLQFDKKQLREQKAKEEVLRSLFKLPGVSKPTEEQKNYFVNLIDKLKDDFPMLKLVSDWKLTDKIVIDYVKSIVNQKEKEVQV